MKFTIVGKTSCPYCHRALALVADGPYGSEYINIDENDTAKRILKLHGHSTVPQVFYQPNPHAVPVNIGGYEELKRFIKPQKD